MQNYKILWQCCNFLSIYGKNIIFVPCIYYSVNVSLLRKSYISIKNGKEIIKRGLLRASGTGLAQCYWVKSDILMQHSDVLQCWVLL